MIPIVVVFPFLLSSVSAHGGILWPPIWQDGVGLAIEDLKDHHVHSDPVVKDPNSGLNIWHSNQWLTDQAYTGGIGDEFMGTGPLTNKDNKKLKNHDRCKDNCVRKRNPWAAPGITPSLGGGCGIFGGNPDGCPAHKDSRPPGSVCGQEEPLGRGKRGTTSFGTDARLVEFPQMITTEWEIGSEQEVAFHTRGSHKGGYTYRLCKLPKKGRTGITEKCFTKNVLEFATNYTMIKSLAALEDGWEKFEQNDLREGTYPKGSVWRPVGKIVAGDGALRKDVVIVPSSLPPGDYVLGWRWDCAGGNQVWVSCSSVRLVEPPAGRSFEDDDDDVDDEDEEDYSLYTEEDYAELEHAFQY